MKNSCNLRSRGPVPSSKEALGVQYVNWNVKTVKKLDMKKDYKKQNWIKRRGIYLRKIFIDSVSGPKEPRF